MGPEHQAGNDPAGQAATPAASGSALTDLDPLLQAAQQQAEAAAFRVYRQGIRREHDAQSNETRGVLGCLFLLLAPSGLIMTFINPAIGLPMLCLAVVFRLIGTGQRDARLQRRRQADREAHQQWSSSRDRV